MDNGMRSVAEPGIILRALVGSTLHGLNLEGTDDRDEMGITIESPDHVVGLGDFEQWVYRTQPEGSPSGPGDLDLIVYSLRKYVRLAIAGNPTVILLLFAPRSVCSVLTRAGEELQALAPSIVSRLAAERYAGYLKDQKERMLGSRGGRALRKKWAIEHPSAGFDTKYAMHMVRLGIQGVELLSTGRITLPMPRSEREFTMAIRRGEVDLPGVLDATEKLESRLEELRTSSPLRERPDKKAIESWMVRTYLSAWHS
jgi:predicted nucleotidyltransferase